MVEKTEEVHSIFNFFKDWDIRDEVMEDLDDEEVTLNPKLLIQFLFKNFDN